MFKLPRGTGTHPPADATGRPQSHEKVTTCLLAVHKWSGRPTFSAGLERRRFLGSSTEYHTTGSGSQGSQSELGLSEACRALWASSGLSTSLRVLSSWSHGKRDDQARELWFQRLAEGDQTSRQASRSGSDQADEFSQYVDTDTARCWLAPQRKPHAAGGTLGQTSIPARRALSDVTSSPRSLFSGDPVALPSRLLPVAAKSYGWQ